MCGNLFFFPAFPPLSFHVPPFSRVPLSLTHTFPYVPLFILKKKKEITQNDQILRETFCSETELVKTTSVPAVGWEIRYKNLAGIKSAFLLEDWKSEMST